METNKIDTCSTCGKNGEIKNENGINISEKHKTFLWLWSKTGTSHLIKVLQHFDFNFYRFEGKRRIFEKKNILQIHLCELFPGHEEYKMMVTARNPYSRYVSLYKMRNENVTFQEFLESQVHSKTNFDCVTFIQRKPDYFIRVENMYNDYLKIPFIVQSDYFKTGLLWEFCNKKINESDNTKDWKEYYNQSLADLVYYSCQNYFTFYDYNRNSWKK